MSQFEFFVAEGDGILGFFILDLGGGELNALYLRPDAVGRGVGRRLFEHAEHLARVGNVLELKLKSTLNAVGFYEVCGFTRVRESVHVIPARVELPCIEMIKTLDVPPRSDEETDEMKR
jgi:GNAT superfamily N-acetyltransferase